jgi:probable phosphoglycerate mutase
MEPSLELWLVRHGQTPSSRDMLLAGWHDVPLTEAGEHEARALRPLLEGRRFDAVWSSDLARAVATARLAYGEPRTDARLREIHFGDLEGRSWVGLEPRHRQTLESFSGFAAPGGESLEDVQARVAGFIGALAPGRHLVFTHGGVIRLIAREAGGDGFPPTGSVLRIDWGRRAVIERLGAASPSPA